MFDAWYKKTKSRQALLDAWEKKYGEPVPRVIANFLLVAEPDQVIRRFGNNPGLHIPPQEIGGVETAGIGWEPSIQYKESEFGEDPKSLAERMVPIYTQAFKEVRKRQPTPAELEMVMAVGRSETMWGTAKFPGGTGIGAHNHGAVQCWKDCDESNSFESSDTHPLDTGGSQRYVVRFKKYPDDLEGAKGLIKAVGNDPLRMLAQNGNLVPAFSLGMFGNRYYEMFNASPEVVKKHYAVFEWIIKHSTRPPSNTSEYFRSSMARAKDPIWAGRVLMHAIAIDKSAEATANTLGVRRATRLNPPILGAAETASAGIGGIIGLYFGGPVGAGVGSLIGLAAGRIIR